MMTEAQARERLRQLVPHGKPVLSSWTVGNLVNHMVAVSDDNEALFGEGWTWEEALVRLDIALCTARRHPSERAPLAEESVARG